MRMRASSKLVSGVPVIRLVWKVADRGGAGWRERRDR